MNSPAQDGILAGKADARREGQDTWMTLSIESHSGRTALIGVQVHSYKEADELTAELRLRDTYRHVTIDGFYERVMATSAEGLLARTLID